MTIVIDANLGLALVVPLPYSDQAEEHLRRWHEDDAQIAVPMLWGYEVTSGLRKAVTKGILTEEDAQRAISFLWALGWEHIPGTPESHARALLWAERLGQPVAYDAQYLAVAEALGARLWTADQRLWRALQQAGAAWVRWIGESVSA